MATVKSGTAARVNMIATTIATLLAAAAQPAFAAESHNFHIAVADASSSVREFANQSGVQIIASASALKDKKLNPVAGQHTTEDALNIMLADTGLRHEYIGERGVVIAPTKMEKTATSLWPRLRVAQADTTATTRAAASAQETVVEEIIVTAQKRSERLQDVPVPVSAITAASLTDNNQTRLNDYFDKVPGVSVSPVEQGATQLVIRGITTGGNTNPTVGIVVDDVPYGSSTVLGGGYISPDFDPSDLQRVEVLRGPQGALYGVASLGGLLKYVTIDPSTEGFSGRVQLGGHGVKNGDELGYSARGSVNIPLGDGWAVRASGFTRLEPGYIDNPVSGEAGVNRTDAQGGRLALMWQPNEDFSVKLSAMLQQNEVHGSGLVLSSLGELKQNFLRDTGTFDTDLDIYSATVKARLGSVDFTSVSGYSVSKYRQISDYSAVFGARAQTAFGVSGAPLDNYNETEKVSQELRFAFDTGENWQWLLGAFYTKEDSESVQSILAADAVSGEIVGRGVDIDFPTTYQEYAAFGSVTYVFTDRFDLQLGARQSRIEQTYSVSRIGPLVPSLYGSPSPLISPEVRPQDDATTYLLTPRFKFSQDLMVYARLASGYRPGGPNTNTSTTAVPPNYDPDTTDNYEIGVKGNAFDRLLSFDASIFYIDWQDIQLQVFVPALSRSVYTNVSRAKSQGVELSLESKPVEGMTVSGWVVRNDAELTEDFPVGSLARGAAGDRLPTSSRLSAYLSLDQEFPLGSRFTGFLGAAVSYLGDRKGVFTAGSAPRQTFPSYTKVDLTAGARDESWSVNLFINNAGDKRGVLLGDPALSTTAYYIQPRTIGMSVAKSF